VTDKRVAEEKLAAIVKEEEQVAHGIGTPRAAADAAQRPLVELQAAFLMDMRAAGRSRNTLKRYGSDLRTLTAACGWCFLRDVRVSSFITWRSQCGLKGKSCNDKLAAMGCFFRWLVRQGMARENPLVFVARSPLCRTPCRRALTGGEIQRLLVAAPHARGVVYLVALKTGLRRSELRQLRWEDVRLVDRGAETKPSAGVRREAGASEAHESRALAGSTPFEASGPCIRARAAITKNGKDACLPLASDVAAALASLRSVDTPSFARVFARGVPKIETFRRDLSRAGIVYQDAAGRRVDFHALRVTFCTLLSLSGASPREAMEAMRHSDLKLTMKIYTDAAQLPVRGAVERLPSFAMGTTGVEGTNVRPKGDDSGKKFTPGFSQDTNCLNHTRNERTRSAI
jgi:integrase